MSTTSRDRMFWRFAAYGFLKNLRFFEPFLLLYFRETFTFFRIGWLYAIREVSTNVLEVPTGVLADRIGRRRTMVLSMIAYLVSFGIFFFTKSFLLYAFAMVWFGAAEALRSGTHKALILSYLHARGWEDRKVAYYGATRSWSQRGSALNALLAGVLVISTRDYRWVFGAAMVPYVLNLINLATYPSWLDERIQRGSSRETIRAFRSMFSPLFLRALVNSALFMGLFRGTKDYLQPVLKDLALTLPILLWWHGQQRTAMVVAVVYFLLYLLNSAVSRNAFRVERALSGDLHRAINLSYLLGAATVVLAGLATLRGWYGVVVLFFVGLYVIQNLRRPLTLGYLSDVIQEERLATGLSVESTVRTLFAAILAPLIGFLADRFGVGGALLGVGILTAGVYPLVTVRPLPARPSENA